jgi:esterase/lipase
MEAAAELIKKQLESHRNYVKSATLILRQRIAPNHDMEERNTVANGDRRSLVVLIHGLNGRPADMDAYAHRLRHLHAIYCPHVPGRGNLSLEASAAPIWRKVLEHLQRHPGAPIALVGLSNGGRVAAQLELWIREHHKDSSVIMVAVVTPFGGTRMMDHFGGLASVVGLYSSTAVDEMQHNSEKSQKLVARMSDSLPNESKRKFVFIAGDQDMIVVPHTSALPHLGHGEEHIVMRSHGHASVIFSNCEPQCRQITEFLNENLHAR